MQPATKVDAEELFWRELHAEGASAAVGHAWVDFKRTAAGGLVVKVNDSPALRVSIKYRESGPYLALERAPGSGETMGSCIRTAKMVKHYADILAAHDALGEKLHSARSFLITDEERALVKMTEESSVG